MNTIQKSYFTGERIGPVLRDLVRAGDTAPLFDVTTAEGSYFGALKISRLLDPEGRTTEDCTEFEARGPICGVRRFRFPAIGDDTAITIHCLSIYH